MKIAALKSINSKDERSPIHPDTISMLLNLGVEIRFEEDIGNGINVNNKVFEELNLTKSSRKDCIKDSDLIITNQPLEIFELSEIKPGATILGMVNPFSNKELIEGCASRKDCIKDSD